MDSPEPVKRVTEESGARAFTQIRVHRSCYLVLLGKKQITATNDRARHRPAGSNGMRSLCAGIWGSSDRRRSYGSL